MKKIPKKKRKVNELYFNEYDGTAEIYTYNTKLKKRLTTYVTTCFPVSSMLFCIKNTYHLCFGRSIPLW